MQHEIRAWTSPEVAQPNTLGTSPIDRDGVLAAHNAKSHQRRKSTDTQRTHESHTSYRTDKSDAVDPSPPLAASSQSFTVEPVPQERRKRYAHTPLAADPKPTLFARADTSLAHARDLVESTFYTTFSGHPDHVQRYDSNLDSCVVPPKQLKVNTATYEERNKRTKWFGRRWWAV